MPSFAEHLERSNREETKAIVSEAMGLPGLPPRAAMPSSINQPSSPEPFEEESTPDDRLTRLRIATSRAAERNFRIRQVGNRLVHVPISPATVSNQADRNPGQEPAETDSQTRLALARAAYSRIQREKPEPAPVSAGRVPTVLAAEASSGPPRCVCPSILACDRSKPHLCRAALASAAFSRAPSHTLADMEDFTPDVIRRPAGAPRVRRSRFREEGVDDAGPILAPRPDVVGDLGELGSTASGQT